MRALQRAAASSGVRISRRTSAADRRRAALGAGMLVVAVVARQPRSCPSRLAAPTARVLRSTIGPEIQLAAEASPLSSYRSLFDEDRADEVLFAVSPEAGAPSRIRLATLDSYDGEVFRAGGGDSADQAHFVRVPASLDGGEGERLRARIAIDSLEGIWMPTAGRLVSATFAGDRAASLADGFYYSAAAEAGVQTAGGGLAAGDSYEVEAVEPDAARARRDRRAREAPPRPSRRPRASRPGSSGTAPARAARRSRDS